MNSRPPERTPLVLVEVSGLDHGPACGERVPSPHDQCQARLSPFLAGERQARPFGVFVLCNGCRTAWRVEDAA